MKTNKPSGNVFLDLGFDSEEAESLRIRSELMLAVRKYIKALKLTQAQAARLLGVSQPRISDLNRGKIGLFSIDMLIDMLAKTGARIKISVIKPRAA